MDVDRRQAGCRTRLSKETKSTTSSTEMCMYTRAGEVAAMEASLGKALEAEMSFEISQGEYDMVKSSMRRDGRAHDLTMFIRCMNDRHQIAVIRKPFFPPGVFRAPSGAACPGEPLEDGAVRESLEETGLTVRLDRYIARISATFTCDGQVIEWTSHVLEALQTAGVLDPIDTEEIAEARWATMEEIQGPIREALLETGMGLFGYRIALTDLTAGVLEEARG